MSELKTCKEKAAELINKMLDHQYHVGGLVGTRSKIRAAGSAIVLVDEIIAHVDFDGISYWGRYWKGVKEELEIQKNIYQS